MILKHYGLLLPGDLDYKPFLQGVYGMTQICNRYLGTSVPVSGGEKVAKEMFEEIMHPKYASIVPTNNKIGIVFYKLRRIQAETQENGLRRITCRTSVDLHQISYP